MMTTSTTLISSQQQDQQLHDDPHSKKRTRVTPTQLAILEDTFSVSATPDSKMRKHLAQKLQMPERSIQIWFQNRRAKVKMLQRRALLREEQDMARAKLYAEAAAAAANGVDTSLQHTGAILSIPSSSSSSSSSPYWYGPVSYHPTTKIPIQRSWSSDPAPSPMGRHPYQQHHHQQIQHHPPQHIYSHQPHQPSNLSSSSIYGTNTTVTSAITPSSSFDGALTGEIKDPFYHHQDISPSPTPNYMGDLDTMKPMNDTTFINHATIPVNKAVTTGIINVNAVTIGTWHRMKINQQDLLCCFQFSERTFEWHIRDSNYHFKMVISFDLVVSLDVTILDNGIFAQMDMELNEPPLFFMENMDDLTWTQCSDFTEGMQATCHLHHTLRGLASDLKQELLGMVSMDQHLCQVIRFPMVPPAVNLPLGIVSGTPDIHYDDEITSLDPSSLMSWRHQSLPLNMNDFEWSHPSNHF
ncbi:homeobox domain-containing protein [Chlamydoabsidia padenii]|nr:homeobox domain-containing protein [Chlamydoabsidia padenii]